MAGEGRGVASTDRRDGMRTARVVDIVREAPGSVTVVFGTQEPLAWRAGQYVFVEFRFGPSRFRRAYSLSNTPADGLPAITVKRVPGGKVSSHIVDRLAIGDAFRVSAPQGQFLLPDSRAGRSFVFVAGGSGISPIMAMLGSLQATPEPPPARLLYFVRQPGEVIFGQRLMAMAQDNARFSLDLVVTGGDGDRAGPRQPVDAARLAGLAAGLEAPLWYVCGPESLITETRSALAGLGVPDTALFVEHFTAPGTVERPAEEQQVIFVRRGLLFRRRRRVRTRPGETLLQAAERSGLKIRHNCRNGTCGSCRVRVLEGEAAMDEPNTLSVADASAGRVLACVAHPLGDLTVEIP